MTTLATPLCDEKVTRGPGAELVAAAAADTVTATPNPPTRAVAETMARKRLRISIPLCDDEKPTKRARAGPPRITRSYPRHGAFCNQPIRAACQGASGDARVVRRGGDHRRVVVGAAPPADRAGHRGRGAVADVRQHRDLAGAQDAAGLRIGHGERDGGGPARTGLSAEVLQRSRDDAG